MDTSEKLPRFGLFSAMCVSGVYAAMMFSQYVSYGASLADFSLSQAAVFVFSIIFIRFVLSRGIHGNITTAVFSLYACAVLLSEMTLFLSSFTHAGIRMMSYIAAVTIGALVVSRRGIFAVCRCAVIFFMINGVIGILGMTLLALRVRSDNFIQIQNTARFCPAAFMELFSLPALYVFSREMPKGAKRPLIFYSVITAGFSAVMSAVSLGTLGAYSYAVRFPLYTAAQTVGIGTFQRLDVLFLCARIIGLFTALSFHFAAVEKVAGRTVQTVGAGAVFALSFISLGSVRFRAVLLDGKVAAAAVIAAVFMPFIIPALSRRRVRAAAAAVLVMCIILSGCSKVQLEDRLIIKGMGIDEINGGVRLTVQYLDNYSDGDRQENKVISTEGKTISDAVGRLKDSTGSEPFLGQNAVVVFGMGAVGERMKASLDYLSSYSESRPTARVYLAEKSAEEILTFEKNGTLIAADRIVGISPSSAPYDNLFTVMSLKNAVSDDTATPVMAVIAVQDDNIRLKTAACIKGGELKLLDGGEYLTFCLMRGLDSESVITMDDVSCEVERCKTDISGQINDGVMYINIKCRPVLSVLEERRGRSDEEITIIMTRKILDEMKRSIAKISINEGVDFGAFVRAFRGDDRVIFKEMLTGAVVDIDLNVRISEAKALR